MTFLYTISMISTLKEEMYAKIALELKNQERFDLELGSMMLKK